jgi:hypothetical protein
MRVISRLIPLLAMIAVTSAPVGAAKYAGEFLDLGVGARPIALGGAYVAESGDALAGYYNPASLAALEQAQATFMHSEAFGALLNEDFLAYARPIGTGENHAGMAASLYLLGGGGIAITDKDQTGRFYKIKDESHTDLAGYFSYGRSFGDRLSGGVTAKLIYRDIVDQSAFGLGLDMAARYVATNWIDLGVNLQDITTTLLSYSTGTKESIFPTAKVGARFHSGRGRFAGSIYTDADVRFEGRDYASQFSTGAISADTHLGLEISYLEKLAARIGSDAGNLTLGAGLKLGRFNVDVAMRDHTDLDNTYLASLTAKF